jgi:carnitine O-acetyltransferase
LLIDFRFLFFPFFLSPSYRQFKRIIARAADSSAGLPVGALTSDNRDLWTDARTDLITASPAHNATLLRQIESAMIIVVLDEAKPIMCEDISWNTWAGNGRNWWFDKHQRTFVFPPPPYVR